VAPQKDFHKWIAEEAEKLSASETRIAAHLVEHLEQWAFESASHLAAQLDLHRSTIVRFAQRLGLRGFSELQAAARQALLKSFAPSSELAWSMEHDIQDDLVQRIYERELQNLRETYHHLDFDALQATARGLADAENVVVFGRRFSYSIAHYLSLAIKTMRGGVRLAPGPGGAAVDLLFDLTPKDFALVVSLRRYSPEVQRALNFLGRAGIPRSLLTDVSPVSDHPEEIYVIQAHTGSTSMLESYTALISVSHALLSMLHRLIPGSQQWLETVERAWSIYNRKK
jgi:DNA-binding MurR/RpiR family transcriptional regulator